MENKPAISHSELEIKEPDYKIFDRSEYTHNRRWKLSISYKTDIFMTREEKDYFIQQIANGKKIIRVNDMILTNKFLSIIPVGTINPTIEQANEDLRTYEEKNKALLKLSEIRDKFKSST